MNSTDPKVDTGDNHAKLTIADLLGAVETTGSDTTSIDEERQQVSDQEKRERETHREGWRKYYELRNRWSTYIFVLVLFIVLFQAALTALVGLRILDFTDYPQFLYLVMGENFAQIVGLGYLVTKFLFPPDPTRK